MKGAIYYETIATVTFSHVKISSFRAKAHLVFHWCLYNNKEYYTVANPDIQIIGGEGSVWSKNKGDRPPLDSPLLHLERVVPLYCQGWIQEGGGEGGLGG